MSLHYTSKNSTQRRSKLAFLAQQMRREADMQRPEIRDRFIQNSRSLSWTYRTLNKHDPEVVDALIDASIEIIVHFASARVPWKVSQS